MRLLALLLSPIFFLASACSSLHYSKVKPGTLKGRLVVEWIGHDDFVFIPDPESPLRFIRHDDTVIAPKRMRTDGGSIPRPLWAFRSYSPWGYAPAFIVHDWLFEAHHLNDPEYDHFTLEESALVMSEVMKTMMEKNLKEKGERPEEFVMYSMYLAVKSSIARSWWDGKGRPILEGVPPPEGIAKDRWTLDYGD
ncbi:MAG: DUF1353 domain-containing protein [Phycisphaerales bacterium]